MKEAPTQQTDSINTQQSLAESEDQYKVKLEMFEGPLDLLLYLIRKEEVSIYDIPIARITEQYLDYLRVMQELDIGLAGEFLVMAATLIHIKTQMLLPRDPDAPEGELEDPRAELQGASLGDPELHARRPRWAHVALPGTGRGSRHLETPAVRRAWEGRSVQRR